VTNRGPHGAANVTVTDPVPAGMRVESVQPATGSCTAAGGLVTCSLGDLADGESVAIRLEAVAEEAGSTRNVASVTTTTPDSDPTNNQDETEVTAEKADLSITKDGPAKPVALGSRVRYKLAVRNAGPSGARGVVVTDPIPDGLRVLKTSASAGSCTVIEGALVCQLGDLDPGASATISVTAKAVRQGRVDNVVSVTSSFPSDPDLGNNTDGVTVRVKPGDAKVELAKRASRDTATAGDRVRYRIVVRNIGARSATGVQVCDRLPAGLSYVRHPGAKLRAGAACWMVRLLAPHTTRSFNVTARVLDGRTRRLVNVAEVKGTNAHERAKAGVRRERRAGRTGGVTG
jgi:large repetitive protein